MKPSWILGVVCCATFACQPERQANEATPTPSANAVVVSTQVTAVSARARQHLPPACDIAVEVDVQKLFDNPMLGPQLLASVVPPKDPTLRAQAMAHPEQAAFLRFLEASKLDPRKDLRSVAFCVPAHGDDSESRFLAIIAGQFPGGLIELMREHAPPGKTYTMEALGTGKALFREGKWMSQGAGNVILFGNDKDLIGSAQHPSDAYKSYALADHADVAVAVNDRVLASMQGPARDPLIALLRRGLGAQLEISLSTGSLKGGLLLADAAAVEQARNAVKALVAQMQAQSQNAPPQMRQMMQPTIQVLQQAELTPDGNRLRFALQLEPGMLEMALQQFAMASLGAGGPAGPAGTMAGTSAPPQSAPVTPTSGPRISRVARATPPQRASLPAQSPAPTSAPMLPQLPSLQLTPPSVLRRDGSATPTQQPTQDPSTVYVPPQ